ncbi:hypothetical protein VC83_07464 [Pseudogymnoascus destructans]|uniref:SET domain-containing protein n=1 Tax=Pseudogymnoascus destructans TaxID=655981 RepID=A0A177A561_9PEZI|nr:uncharacterized protein VC83_07464 [Pseudogymnoascus destructans]OAF56094.1 hypothetical protein VC83_07464 [Pseudogymnoascus destructans]
MSGNDAAKAGGVEPAGSNPIDDLVRWAKSHGAYLNDDVEVYHSPEFGISLRVKPLQQSRLSTPAAGSAEETPTAPPITTSSPTTSLPPRSRIVSCPFPISLSYLNALSAFPDLPSHSPPLPASFLTTQQPKVIGCFFLIQQYLRGSSSHWAPYIRSLPQPDEPHKLATPLYYPEEARRWLGGTNLPAAIAQREGMWRGEFEGGVGVLEGSKGMEGLGGEWTWELYKWASTIFSSRSFVSKLIPDEVYGDVLDQPVDGYPSWREKIAEEGPYPVLFPLLDIANHDAKAWVEWFVNAQGPVKDFSIITDAAIGEGEQVFNNYAPKGNTELLLGYGFCIPGNDDVAIELKCPSEEKRRIWGAQKHGYKVPGGASEKWIFHVRSRPYPAREGDNRVEEFRVFEEGLIDTLAILVANEREEKFLQENPEYSVESNLETSLYNFMGRNALCALSVLLAQLRSAKRRILEAGNDLGDPAAQFEVVAQQYRSGQLATLGGAIEALHAYLETLKVKDDTEDYTIAEWPQSPIIDVRSAFPYLKANHPTVWNTVAQSMAPEDTLKPYLGFSASPEAGTGEDVSVKDLSARNCSFAEMLDNGRGVAMLCVWTWCVLMVHHSENNDLSDGLDVWLEDLLQFHSTTPTFDSDPETTAAMSLMTTRTLAVWPTDYPLRSAARRRVNRMHPALIPGDDKDADFARKMVSLAMRIVRSSVFETGISTKGLGPQVLQEVIFVPRMKDEEGA